MVLHEHWSFNERTFRSIFENINNLRKNRILCDVILKVDNEEYYAHRGTIFCQNFHSNDFNFNLLSYLICL